MPGKVFGPHIICVMLHCMVVRSFHHSVRVLMAEGATCLAILSVVAMDLRCIVIAILLQ